MTIYIFGNQDLAVDSLPLRILPKLQKEFPEIQFKIVDPNEEWDVPEEFVIIDSVMGIDKVTVFDSLKSFVPAPNVTMHDFDAHANLRYLQKLGRLKKIKIIGIPPMMDEDQACKEASLLIPFYF